MDVGQLVVPPDAPEIVQSVPGVLDPVTSHCVSALL